jgi:hypothetical protein
MVRQLKVLPMLMELSMETVLGVREIMLAVVVGGGGQTKDRGKQGEKLVKRRQFSSPTAFSFFSNGTNQYFCLPPNSTIW